MPTTSAHVARLRIFQPTRSPDELLGEWIETPWGRSRISGKLGTPHATLMEVLQFTALGRFREPDGRESLLIDPHIVRKMMSARRGGKYSAQGLSDLLDDLRDADVEWELKNGRAGGVSKIVSEKAWADVTVANPLGGRGLHGQTLPDLRRLWRITLSAPWVALVEGAGLAIYRDPVPVIRIKHAVAQAAARFMLTHKPGTRYSIETVLDGIGIPGASVARRNARRRIRDACDELAAAGVEVDSAMLKRVIDAPRCVTDAPECITDAPRVSPTPRE